MGACHLRQAKSFCFLIVRQMWSHGDVVFKHHLKSQQDFGEEDVPPVLCQENVKTAFLCRVKFGKMFSSAL